MRVLPLIRKCKISEGTEKTNAHSNYRMLVLYLTHETHEGRPNEGQIRELRATATSTARRAL